VFVQAISQLELSPESCSVLQQVYATHYTSIVQTTAAFSMSLPEYRHLDWRVDVEIGRRTVAQDAKPQFMLRLDLAEGGGGGKSADGVTRSVHLTSDYANLKNLLAQLEAAVAEERSVHARRFQRYIR
jgi:hypothetical protein